MAKSISKAELIELVSEKTNMTRKDVKTIVDTLFEQMEVSLKKGFKVQLTGFGTFEVRRRKAKVGVMPGTTDPLKIPARKFPAFKASKALKDIIG
jgi:DNA-binding protein HU-beta